MAVPSGTRHGSPEQTAVEPLVRTHRADPTSGSRERIYGKSAWGAMTVVTERMHS